MAALRTGPGDARGRREGALRPGARRFYAAALIALGLWFGWAFQNNEIIREDTVFLLPEGSVQMADYINARLPESRILMDAYRAYFVFMNLDNPDNVVISSSVDFYESLADPAAHGVAYIMAPESGSYGDMDAVNIAYRSLYYGGAPWCEEVASIGEFKLFRVTDSVRAAAIGEAIMHSAAATSGRGQLGEFLAGQGFLSREELEKALEYQRVNGGRLGEICVGLGFMSPRAAGRGAAALSPKKSAVGSAASRARPDRPRAA
jgi:hypothetical protein